MAPRLLLRSCTLSAALLVSGCLRIGLEPLGATAGDGDLDADSAEADLDAGTDDAEAPSDAEPDDDAPDGDRDGDPDEAGEDADDVVCPEVPCRLVAPQCGCPDGQACLLDEGGGRLCGSAGVGAPDSTCSAHADCGVGMGCSRFDLDTLGSCRPYCVEDGTCASPPEACLQLLAGDEPVDVGLCTRECDPIAGTVCPAGLTCDVGSLRRFETGGSVSATYCREEGTLGEGWDCSTGERCGPGLTCVLAGDFGFRCLRICEIGGAACPWDAMCIPLFSDAGYGTCELVTA